MYNFEDKIKKILISRNKRNINDLSRDQLLTSGKKYISAAILFPLIQRNNDLNVILTRRPEEMMHHPGQVCFPGGKYNSNDKNMENCAKREAKEEIGIEKKCINILGELDHCFTGTGFKIAPIVALINNNYIPKVNKREVSEVFEVPLNYFLDFENRKIISNVYKGKNYSFYEYLWKDKKVWGSTAKIIVNFCDILKKYI